MKPIFRIAVLTLLLFSNAALADQWNFNDPGIAAAAMGMLSPILKDKNFCPSIRIVEKRFIDAAKANKFMPDEIRQKCASCYKNGSDGAANLIEQKGQKNYCDAMEMEFGNNGSMIKGLVE